MKTPEPPPARNDLPLRASACTAIGKTSSDDASSAPHKSGGPRTSIRLASLDAYRGLVMFLMMAEALELRKMAATHPGSGFWNYLARQQTDVEWTGCSLHDLIQPSFSFLVGAALSFSLARRLAGGQSRFRMTVHALARSVILVLLGVLLRSLGHKQIYWTFEDTLSQIGLGYLGLFALGFRPAREQWLAFGLLLLGYWAAFALYPLPGPDFDYSRVGVAQDWPHLFTGFAAHWNKNSNLAWVFDTWFLNLFPRETRFAFNSGGYSTLSFIPTLATMVLGLLAGNVLRSERTAREKVRWLFAAGALGLIFGSLLGWLGLCPVVKRIWTPSWVLFSGGWCLLGLAAFYCVIELWNQRTWAFPLIVLGMNSIAAYCVAQVFDDVAGQALRMHLGSAAPDTAGSAWLTLAGGALSLLVLWSILFVLYRRKWFVRI